MCQILLLGLDLLGLFIQAILCDRFKQTSQGVSQKIKIADVFSKLGN